jgi:hypothetical protein
MQLNRGAAGIMVCVTADLASYARLNSELFLELSRKRARWGFAALDFASGELPFEAV